MKDFSKYLVIGLGGFLGANARYLLDGWVQSRWGTGFPYGTLVIKEAGLKIEGAGKLIRIYVGESDKWHGHTLFKAIVERAKREGLAGATVTRGIEGFGANSRIHTASILRLSEDLPIKIEIVDLAERVEQFLPLLDDMVSEGLITVQDCQIVKYVHGKEGKGS